MHNSSSASVINMVLLIAVGTLLMLALFGAYAWMRRQRNRKPLDDVDWKKEEEILLTKAVAKKAERKHEKPQTSCCDINQTKKKG